MSNNFSKLRNRSLQEKLATINKALQSRYKKDDRYWKLAVDKAGNGYATIRFLDAPAVDGNDGVPFVQYFGHSFQGPSGSYYIERSLTTFGDADPVFEMNAKLYATKIEANIETAKKRKRSLNYVSNILVVADPTHPENNGKTFLFRYGQKIFAKIRAKQGFDEKGDALQNLAPDEVLFDPFDLWSGANFQLKARKVADFPNYDASYFSAQSAVAASDEEIKKIWEGAYSLKEVVDRKNFKTYAELQDRLNSVLGLVSVPKEAARTVENVTLPEIPADDVGTEVPEETSTEEDQFAMFKRLAAGST